MSIMSKPLSLKELVNSGEVFDIDADSTTNDKTGLVKDGVVVFDSDARRVIGFALYQNCTLGWLSYKTIDSYINPDEKSLVVFSIDIDI